MGRLFTLMLLCRMMCGCALGASQVCCCCTHVSHYASDGGVTDVHPALTSPAICSRSMTKGNRPSAGVSCCTQGAVWLCGAAIALRHAVLSLTQGVTKGCCGELCGVRAPILILSREVAYGHKPGSVHGSDCSCIRIEEVDEVDLHALCAAGSRVCPDVCWPQLNLNCMSVRHPDPA